MYWITKYQSGMWRELVKDDHWKSIIGIIEILIYQKTHFITVKKICFPTITKWYNRYFWPEDFKLYTSTVEFFVSYSAMLIALYFVLTSNTINILIYY